MNPFDVNSIIDDLKIGAVDAARQVASNMLQEAAKDAAAFVSMAAPSIIRYIDLVLTKQISLEEFESLMLGLLALAKMNGLTQAGLAEVEVDRTRNTILKTVTGIAMSSVSKFI